MMGRILRGGVRTHVDLLSAELSQRGHQVVTLPPSTFRATLRDCIRLIQGRFHIVHVQGIGVLFPSAATLVVLWIYKALTGTPVVLTIHYFRPPTSTRLNWLLNKVDGIIYVSKYMQSQVRLACPVNVRVQRIVYNGFDAATFAQEAANHPPMTEKFGENRKIVLFVGNLVPDKGLDYLLEGFIEARKQNEDLTLVVCGTGPLRKSLEQTILNFELRDVVFLAGYVSRDELPSYYLASDICVFPSVYEPFGLVMLEAMSMRKPVISTTVGGVPEIVKSGVTGILVPPRDAHALGKAILDLASNPGFADNIAENGYQLVRRSFAVDHMVDETVRTYLDLILQRRSITQ
jgi:glycogen(starch) synthase